MRTLHQLFLVVVTFLGIALPCLAQREFGFDNTRASGQPYLTPQESLKRLKVPDGFTVAIAAAEPAVINPIAFTVDERGRIWVVECFEYPKRTAKGKMPRDRIKVLESTKGDGIYDKVTIFAEGKDFPKPFDLASGIEVGRRGVFLGAPPYLWFIQDTDGDGKADKFDILLEGFGSQDTHETLNTFHWGPDGKLYGLHGVFTHSDVKATQADGPATRMDAALWSYDVDQRKIAIFAEGTSNPWGTDWRNTDGQQILACCVIPHLFHMAPGGSYKRQAGQSFNPFAYGDIPEICDHTFHKESGWAHAGLLSLDTPLMPAAYRDSVIFGSIHGTSIKRNTLKPNGSTYCASRADDFLQSADKNFRPINLRWGPNGEIFVIDWHDQNPCHQAAAESWDYERGRIYSIRPPGFKAQPAQDMGHLAVKELIALVDDPNPYRYRTALRLLEERRGRTSKVEQTQAIATITDPLRRLLAAKALGVDSLPTEFTELSDAAVRGMAVRFAAYNAAMTTEYIAKVLTPLATGEKASNVRRELASAAIHLAAQFQTQSLLHALIGHGEDQSDPVIPHLVWLAYEPKLMANPAAELAWLSQHAPGNELAMHTIVTNSTRRLAASGKADLLALATHFLADATHPVVRWRAVDGLAAALRGRQVDAPREWAGLATTLAKDANAETRRLAQELGIAMRDETAMRRALAKAKDRQAAVEERRAAIGAVGLSRPADGGAVLLDLLAQDTSTELRAEACRALAGYEAPEIAAAVLAGWKEYPATVRVEAVNLLAGRKGWAASLLTAIAEKKVPRADVSDNTILRMRALKDAALDKLIETAWGKVRETPAELAALIDTMRGQLQQAPGSFERGRVVFENQCSKCHKFEGKGHEVGPALDGAGRDIEYLLVNVLDPNRVIGAPYFIRLATLKNGTVFTGILAAEDDTSVTLKTENDALKVIQKKDLEEFIVQEKSIMPEGLANAMTVQDFRDLVRYVMASPFLIDVHLATGVDKAPPLNDPAWKKPMVGVPGRITLPSSKEATKAFLRAEFTSATAFKTQLMLGSAQPLQVWLDDKLIYTGKPGNEPTSPDQASVPITLSAGEHRLVIEVAYRGERAAVFARVLDPERRVRYAEVSGK